MNEMNLDLSKTSSNNTREDKIKKMTLICFIITTIVVCIIAVATIIVLPCNFMQELDTYMPHLFLSMLSCILMIVSAYYYRKGYIDYDSVYYKNAVCLFLAGILSFLIILEIIYL